MTRKACTFCAAMKSREEIERLTHDPDLVNSYSVAIVLNTYRKGCKGVGGRATSYRKNGHGYPLNFCPECGTPIGKGGKA